MTTNFKLNAQFWMYQNCVLFWKLISVLLLISNYLSLLSYEKKQLKTKLPTTFMLAETSLVTLNVQ